MKVKNEQKTSTWVLVLTSVASFMISLDVQVVSTALATIRTHLHASIEQLTWTVNASILTFAVLILMGAALGDRYGRRRVFVAGLGLFVVASAACGLAPTIETLIIARLVQGCGAALMLPLALTLLSTAFPPAQRGRALGIFSSITGLALIAGPVVGGAIAGGIAWQWIFWVNVPIGLLVMILVLFNVPESTGSHIDLDIGGLLFITGATLGLVWGLVRGNQAGWGSFEVLTALIVGGGLAVAFVRWERRIAAPMVPMRFFRSRAFSSGNIANFLLFASMNGAAFFMAQFLQTAQGYGPLAAGLRLLPWTATLFVVAPIAGILVNRVGERLLVVGGLTLVGVGFTWVALIAKPDLPYAALILPFIIAGCGASMAIPATQHAVINAVAVNEIGQASGTFSMLRQLSGVFGIAILAAVFAGAGGFRSAWTFRNGFVAALGIAATLAFVGAIAGLILPARRDEVLIGTVGANAGTRQHGRIEQSASV